MPYISRVRLRTKKEPIGDIDIVTDTDNTQRIKDTFVARAVRRFYPDKKIENAKISDYYISDVLSSRKISGL